MKDREPIECYFTENLPLDRDKKYADESEVRELEAYTTELEQRIEAMKCCGNCKEVKLNINLLKCIGCKYGYGIQDNWQRKEGE